MPEVPFQPAMPSRLEGPPGPDTYSIGIGREGDRKMGTPFLLHSQFCRPDEVTRFSERTCARGSLGTFPTMNLMPLALANARRLNKYGA